MAVSTIGFRIRAVDLGIGVGSCEAQRLTFWLVPAKLNCLDFIRNPHRPLGGVKTRSAQYNRSVNAVFDENFMSRLECTRFGVVAIRASKY